MKIRMGSQTIEPFSGLTQHIVLQARIYSELFFNKKGYVSTETGIEKHLGQDNVPSPLGLIGRMTEGKLLPTTRLIYTFLGSRRVKGQPWYIRTLYGTGQEVDLREEAKDALSNLTVKATKESYEEQGGFWGTFVTALAILGWGVSRDQLMEEQSQKRQIRNIMTPDAKKLAWEKAFKSYAKEGDTEMAKKAFEKATVGTDKKDKAIEIFREARADNVAQRFGIKKEDTPMLFERIKTGKNVSSASVNNLTTDLLDRIRNDYNVQYNELKSLIEIMSSINKEIDWKLAAQKQYWFREYQKMVGEK
jgi:hypothetical protein